MSRHMNENPIIEGSPQTAEPQAASRDNATEFESGRSGNAHPSGHGRNAVAGAGLVVTALLLSVLLRYFVPLTHQFFEGVELRLVDARFLTRQSLLDETPQAAKIAAERVAIIGIDSAVMGEFGFGGVDVLPRAVHARLVRRLKAAGAKAVIFDVVFADPSKERPSDDLAFAAACREAGNVFLPFDDDASQPSAPALLKKVEDKLSYPRLERGQARMVRLQPPYPQLFGTMRGGGHVVTNADSDSKFRSAILLLENGAVFPHVALDAVRAAWGVERSQVELRGSWLHVGERRIGPLEKRPLRRSVYDSRLKRTGKEDAGMAWMIPLNFFGNHQVMQTLTVPYLDALHGRADAELKDRIIIIGATATGTRDLRPGPLDTNEVFLGVETNATLIANLLQNSFMNRAGALWDLAAMVLAGGLTGLAVVRLRPWAALLLAAGGALVYAVAAMFTFISADIILEMAGPLLAVLACYGLPTSYRLIVEERAARELAAREATVRQLLGQYIDERLSNRLRDDPAAQRDLEIGTRREVTILFSDIRGFTAWSEQHQPEEVSARLDEYFPTMCEIVRDDHDGYIDKYIGDALMVVWNAGIDGTEQADHAARAVRAALSMQRALMLLNDGWRKQGQAEFRIGIGIATGRVIFGAFGSRKHKVMPTALGDTVNLASRLEGATKETGSNIIISGATYEAVRDIVEARPLSAMPIRGKSEVVQMYEVLGLRRDGDDLMTLRFPLPHLSDTVSGEVSEAEVAASSTAAASKQEVRAN